MKMFLIGGFFKNLVGLLQAQDSVGWPDSDGGPAQTGKNI